MNSNNQTAKKQANMFKKISKSMNCYRCIRALQEVFPTSTDYFNSLFRTFSFENTNETNNEYINVINMKVKNQIIPVVFDIFRSREDAKIFNHYHSFKGVLTRSTFLDMQNEIINREFDLIDSKFEHEKINHINVKIEKTADILDDTHTHLVINKRVIMVNDMAKLFFDDEIENDDECDIDQNIYSLIVESNELSRQVYMTNKEYELLDIMYESEKINKMILNIDKVYERELDLNESISFDTEISTLVYLTTKEEEYLDMKHKDYFIQKVDVVTNEICPYIKLDKFIDSIVPVIPPKYCKICGTRRVKCYDICIRCYEAANRKRARKIYK